MTYPDGETLTYTYTDRMLLNSLAGTATYVSSTTYDSAGRIDLRILGNSRRTDYVYYPWTQQGGRLQYIKSGTSGSPTSLQNLTYTYDPVGNVLTITDSLAGPQTQTFAYDALDRLTSASASGGSSGLYSETYTYNASTGNLASKGGVTYTYSASHAHAVSSLSNGNTYSYDANGNMTQRVVGGQTYNLTYDAENRLISVSGAATASFLYDADGKQVKAVVGSTTTYYVGMHYQVDNGVVTKYYLAGASRIAMRKNGTLYYLLGDHLGSTSITLNSSGSKIAELRYKAWGETRYSSGTTYTAYQFTSQRNETALGLYFYNARWYDPALARFTSADTLVPGGVQGYDRYAYASNNPVKYVDPSGHNPCSGLSDYRCQVRMRKMGEDASSEDNSPSTDTTFCNGEPQHQTCTWTFTGSLNEDPDLIESFLKMLRELDDDPFGTASNVGDLAPTPFLVSVLKGIIDIFRNTYYQKIDDFEEEVSGKFESSRSQKMEITFLFTEEVNYTKEGSYVSYVRGNLTVSSTGPKSRFMEEVTLTDYEAYKAADWFIDHFGR